MSRDRLPPLRIEDTGERYYVIDELVPGFIEAHSGIQSGAPCIAGTRMPTYATWVWEYLDKPDPENVPCSREQIIAAYAFQMGMDWQRSRKRRQRITDAQAINWGRIKEGRKGDYEPGDELI